MVCKIRTVLAIAALAFTLGLQPPAHAQDSNAKTLETGDLPAGKFTALQAVQRSTRRKTGG